MNFLLVGDPCDSVELPGDLVSARVSLVGTKWAHEVVLIVDMGQQRTAGYGVQVSSVNLIDADQVDLALQVTAPGRGMMVAQVLTHPYAVCRIPRAGLRPGEITVTAHDQNGTEVGRQVVQL